MENQMCCDEEVTRAVEPKINVDVENKHISLLPKHDVGLCGYPSPSVSRLVGGGGDNAELGEFPWMAALNYRSKNI